MATKKEETTPLSAEKKDVTRKTVAKKSTSKEVAETSSVKKSTNRPKASPQKIEEIISGNWHDGFATEHIAELNDGTFFKLCYTSQMNQINILYALKVVS